MNHNLNKESVHPGIEIVLISVAITRLKTGLHKPFTSLTLFKVIPFKGVNESICYN